MPGFRPFEAGEDNRSHAEKGDQVIYGKDPNKPISIDEWVSGLQQDAPNLFKMSAGAGTPPSSGGTSNAKVVRLSREEAKDPQTSRGASLSAPRARYPQAVPIWTCISGTR